ncbi:hypothetical protein I7I48_10753 [Histoplasma ohiense]|nr:hypothetical protein I7I48_10753 [Histoplasma ohiense (nom. inval.)]
MNCAVRLLTLCPQTLPILTFVDGTSRRKFQHLENGALYAISYGFIRGSVSRLLSHRCLSRYEVGMAVSTF